MFAADDRIASFDAELGAALDGERRRQERLIELIASENYVSPRVLEAQGSQLTNKYADGYPARRDYSGCEFVDVAENFAIARAKALFGAAHANVQPCSGSQANAAAYAALLGEGDTLLGGADSPVGAVLPVAVTSTLCRPPAASHARARGGDEGTVDGARA